MNNAVKIGAAAAAFLAVACSNHRPPNPPVVTEPTEEQLENALVQVTTNACTETVKLVDATTGQVLLTDDDQLDPGTTCTP